MVNHPPQSLLAEGTSPEYFAQLVEEGKIKQHNIKVAMVFLAGWLEAYTVGDITFETYCHNVQRNLQALKLDGFERQKKLGFAVEEALKVNVATRFRGSRRKNPLWLCRMCHELVALASADGLPKTKISNKLTAFEKISQLLTSYGVDLCPAERVAKLCAVWRKEGGGNKSKYST